MSLISVRFSCINCGREIIIRSMVGDQSYRYDYNCTCGYAIPLSSMSELDDNLCRAINLYKINIDNDPEILIGKEEYIAKQYLKFPERFSYFPYNNLIIGDFDFGFILKRRSRI